MWKADWIPTSLHFVVRSSGWWLLSLFFVSSPLLAQASDDGYFGLHVGYFKLQDVDDDGSFNVGLDGGYYFFSGFAVGASLDFQKSEFTFETEDFSITFPEFERETFSLQLDLNFTPLPYRAVRPYVLGGVGYYWSKYSNESFSDGHVSDEGYFAGVGLDMFGDGWRGGDAIVIEARWLFTQEATYGEAKFAPDGFNVSVGFRAKF